MVERRPRSLLLLVILGTVIVSVNGFVACAPPVTVPGGEMPLKVAGEKETATATVVAPAESKTLVLTDELTRNCQPMRTGGGFTDVGLAEGETAVDFTLEDVQGNSVSLSELLAEKPVVMVFGSFT